MIDKVKQFWWLKTSKYWGSEEQRQKHIRKMAETRHPCSCDACCNQRRNEWQSKKERLTLQERRHEDYGNDY